MYTWNKFRIECIEWVDEFGVIVEEGIGGHRNCWIQFLYVYFGWQVIIVGGGDLVVVGVAIADISGFFAQRWILTVGVQFETVLTMLSHMFW